MGTRCVPPFETTVGNTLNLSQAKCGPIRTVGEKPPPTQTKGTKPDSGHSLGMMASFSSGRLLLATVTVAALGATSSDTSAPYQCDGLPLIVIPQDQVARCIVALARPNAALGMLLSRDVHMHNLTRLPLDYFVCAELVP